MRFLIPVCCFLSMWSCDIQPPNSETKNEASSRAAFKELKPSVLEGYTPLFNNKDLDGWYFVFRDTLFDGKLEDIFRVENEEIHVYPVQEADSRQTFAGIITKDSFSRYKLHVEYKWGSSKFKPRQDKVRDAGLLFFFFCEDKIWPFSVECQIQEGDTGDIWVIGTEVTSRVSKVTRNYNPNGELVTRSTGKDQIFQRFHRGYSWEVRGWNVLDLEVDGENAKYYLNGHLVNEALDMKFWDESSGQFLPLNSGKILLQAEGAELYYRNIQIKQL